jgi:hypothetical protein
MAPVETMIPRLAAVLLGAAVLAGIVWLNLVLGQRRARRAIEAAGGKMMEGPGALEVTPTRTLLAAPRTPKGSASFAFEGKRFGPEGMCGFDWPEED